MLVDVHILSFLFQFFYRFFQLVQARISLNASKLVTIFESDVSKFAMNGKPMFKSLADYFAKTFVIVEKQVKGSRDKKMLRVHVTFYSHFALEFCNWLQKQRLDLPIIPIQELETRYAGFMQKLYLVMNATRNVFEIDYSDLPLAWYAVEFDECKVLAEDEIVPPKMIDFQHIWNHRTIPVILETSSHILRCLITLKQIDEPDCAIGYVQYKNRIINTINFQKGSVRKPFDTTIAITNPCFMYISQTSTGYEAILMSTRDVNHEKALISQLDRLIKPDEVFSMPQKRTVQLALLSESDMRFVHCFCRSIYDNDLYPSYDLRVLSVAEH